MASFDELSTRDRLLLAAYPWRRAEPAWAPPRGPLSELRVAVVTSAGFYRPGLDLPFRPILGGDASWRALPADVDLSALRLGQVSHSFDRRALKADPASGFPVPHVAALAAAGIIGAVAPRHVSVNGSILAAGRLVKQTGPAIADLLAQDQVDLALFVPV